MKVASQETQEKIRRIAAEHLQVYDMRTNKPMGQVLDLSAKGAKLKSQNPVVPRQIYYCRLALIRSIKDCREVFFDAECRWCKKSEETGWYTSGFFLRFSSQKDADIIRELMRSWMVHHTNSQNARYTTGRE